MEERKCGRPPAIALSAADQANIVTVSNVYRSIISLNQTATNINCLVSECPPHWARRPCLAMAKPACHCRKVPERPL